jgi:hypothetical protein
MNQIAFTLDEDFKIRFLQQQIVELLRINREQAKDIEIVTIQAHNFFEPPPYSFLDSLKGFVTLLLQGSKITSDGSKIFSFLLTSEKAGNFMFHFHHVDSLFGKVFSKGY